MNILGVQKKKNEVLHIYDCRRIAENTSQSQSKVMRLVLIQHYDIVSLESQSKCRSKIPRNEINMHFIRLCVSLELAKASSKRWTQSLQGILKKVRFLSTKISSIMQKYFREIYSFLCHIEANTFCKKFLCTLRYVFINTLHIPQNAQCRWWGNGLKQAEGDIWQMIFNSIFLAWIALYRICRSSALSPSKCSHQVISLTRKCKVQTNNTANRPVRRRVA